MNIGLAIDKKNGVESKVIGQNEWDGWGTQLKPSYEPIIVARKPVERTVVENVLKYGVGGINIDECRVPLEDGYEFKTTNRKARQDGNVFDNSTCGFDSENNTTASASPKGRFPANIILTYDETDYSEVCGGFPMTKGGGKVLDKGNFGYCFQDERDSKPMADGYDDNGSASRYFYCAKASKKDRDDGNTHPTVKPTSLMRYLIKLVTPKGGIVLDPFNGSGSTGKAVIYENEERDANYKYIGIELNDKYLDITKTRLENIK